MYQIRLKKIQMCPKFLHKTVIASLLCLGTLAGPSINDSNLLEAFNPTYKIKTRTPQSFIVDTDYFIAPKPSDTSIFASVFVDDGAGVLKKMKDNYDTLIERDEYAKNWNMDSTGMYKVSSQEDRVNYFNKNILKYVDKRISGEVKKAEEGSAMSSVGAVQSALKPNTKVQISENIKVKFKAQVLQGYADVIIENPYVECSSSVNLSGEVKMYLRKKFNESRSIASMEYNANEANYITQVDQNITDKLTARISSSQSQSNAIFSQNSDSRFQFIYSTPFNY